MSEADVQKSRQQFATVRGHVTRARAELESARTHLPPAASEERARLGRLVEDLGRMERGLGVKAGASSTGCLLSVVLVPWVVLVRVLTLGGAHERWM